MLKRLLDVLGASLLMVITAPVFVFAAVLISLNDPGPIFFRQMRIGRRGVPFEILKFRTMRSGQLSSSVTSKNDPRVFRGGDFLRRFKIDELPQLVNVLAGEMSLVGPRPTVAEDYGRMSPEQRTRASVRPGITGLAQVSGNTELPWRDRINLDIEYVRRMSIWLDIKIIAKTAFLVLTDRAETHPDGDDEWK